MYFLAKITISTKYGVFLKEKRKTRILKHNVIILFYYKILIIIYYVLLLVVS